MRDKQLNTWLRERVAPALDAIRADPSRGVSVDRVRRRLAAEHAAAKKKLSRPN
jgi:hypothetical protein